MLKYFFQVIILQTYYYNSTSSLYLDRYENYSVEVSKLNINYKSLIRLSILLEYASNIIITRLIFKRNFFKN